MALFTRRERVEEVRRRIADAGVQRAFLICATPRTGSTMLADLLAASGAVGRAGEFFNPHTVASDARIDVGSYLAGCARREAAGTGVFGIKLHWDQHQTFLSLLRRLGGASGRSDGDLIADVLSRPRYLFVTRDDAVAQGVSWWKAKGTRVWHDDDEPLADAVFDYDAIDERVRLAREQTESWRRWFAANAIAPLPVVYEQLVTDPEGVARQSLSFLGADVVGDRVLRTRTRRQADELNEQWIRRYRELAEAR
jgi:trehalose 2-sulfotransferase